MFSLFCKGSTSYEILWFYDVQITHTKFIDKICNLIVIINLPKTKYEFISIIKYKSDSYKVISIEIPGTIKVIKIDQYLGQ